MKFQQREGPLVAPTQRSGERTRTRYRARHRARYRPRVAETRRRITTTNYEVRSKSYDLTA